VVDSLLLRVLVVLVVVRITLNDVPPGKLILKDTKKLNKIPRELLILLKHSQKMNGVRIVKKQNAS